MIDGGSSNGLNNAIFNTVSIDTDIKHSLGTKLTTVYCFPKLLVLHDCKWSGPPVNCVWLLEMTASSSGADAVQLEQIRGRLDVLESEILLELSANGQDLIANLPLLKGVEEDLRLIMLQVTDISNQVTQVIEANQKNQDELATYKDELEQVTDMIKLAQSVKQLLISKSTAKAFMDEGDFQNAAAFLGSVLTDSKRLSSITTCNELFAELSDMSLAVQKLLANSSSGKPRPTE